MAARRRAAAVAGEVSGAHPELVEGVGGAPVPILQQMLGSAFYDPREAAPAPAPTAPAPTSPAPTVPAPTALALPALAEALPPLLVATPDAPAPPSLPAALAHRMRALEGFSNLPEYERPW